MDDYIGEIGEIIDVDSVSVQVCFKNNDTWWYPIDGIEAHFVQVETEQQDKIITNYEIY
jgi:hypothetical protein